MIGPVDAAGLQILADRLNGTQKFALLDGERAHRELDRRALPNRSSASSMVTESFPPDSATATRSPSRIILKRVTASPTLRSSVFSSSNPLV